MLSMIIRSLQRKKRRFLLIFIQFTVGFFVLFFGAVMLDDVYEFSRQVENQMSLDTLHPYIENGESCDRKSLKNVSQKLKASPMIDQVGTFEELYIIQNKSSKDDIPFLVMDQGLYKWQHFEMAAGNTEELLNYNHQDKVIPVLVSDSLSAQYQLGKVYPLKMHEEAAGYSMKIIGILDEDYGVWFGGASQITDSIKKDTDVILGPQFFDYTSDLPYSTNMLVHPKKEALKSQLLDEMQQIYEEEELCPSSIESLQDEVDEYMKSREPVIVASFVFAGILLLLSMLGCTGTILSMLLSRQEEFGTYFTLGITKWRLVEFVIGEIFVTFLAGFVVAYVLALAVIQGILSQEGFAIRLNSILLVLAIVIVSAMLCVALPMKKMLQMDPIELLNERNGK